MSDSLKYLPFLLIGAIVLVQLFIHYSARRMRGRSLSEFGDVLAPHWLTKKRLVLYFSSAYCAPCKGIAPMIDRLVDEGLSIVKFDAIEHGDLANRLGVRGAPAFVEVRQGRIIKVHLGTLTEGKLRQMVE